MAGITKARYWWAVLYPENMVEGWEDCIGDTLQVPYAYCVHGMDTDGKSEHRKDHVHLIIVFKNTTTYEHALSVFKLLGEKAVNTCQAVVNIRHAYDYLIHDTETCRKAGKHLYDPAERITGNNFDIGSYEQIGQVEKLEMLNDICNFVRDNGITNLSDAMFAVQTEFEDVRYWEVFTVYNAMIDRICKGEYLRWQRKIPDLRVARHTQAHEAHGVFCPICGSDEIKKRGKTPGGTQRFSCKECGKTFVL